MQRGDRLFEIIQILRGADRPMTAAALATVLEVTKRTIYRDVATLQARRVPIEGAAGIGYILRPGFDLPPLMFTPDEIEAIIVGSRLIRRTGDVGLQKAAENVLSKVAVTLPGSLRSSVDVPRFHVVTFGATIPPAIDLGKLRSSVREARKLSIDYVDAKGDFTSRTVRPIAVAYYIEVVILCAWCELRTGYRHFRIDRIRSFEVLRDDFLASRDQLMAGWLAQTEAPSGILFTRAC